MKKNIGFIALIAAVLAMTVMLAPKPAYTTVTMPTNTLYTATISTFSATDAGAAADINLATVKVKCISIANTTATAQPMFIANENFNFTCIKRFRYNSSFKLVAVAPTAAYSNLSSLQIVLFFY